MSKVVIPVGLMLLCLFVLDQEDRLPCNAPGDVRYVGATKYECVQTTFDGLRWEERWR